MLSDEDLIQRYLQSSDNNVVGELYNRYARLVFGVCLKYLKNKDESKDTLLLIFEKLLKDLKKYEIKNFKSWLYTYTKNECLMALRKATTKTLEADVHDLNIATADEEAEATTDETVYQKLEESVRDLSEEQRTCIQLFYLENKSYNEIATITGLNFNQIKSFIQNGKRNLRLKLNLLNTHE